MSRFGFGVEIVLQAPSFDALDVNAISSAGYVVELGFWMGDGPMQVTIGPSAASAKTPVTLREMVRNVATMVKLEQELGPFNTLTSNEPWKSVFDVAVNPYLTVQVSGQPSVELVLKLFKDGAYGVHLPPKNLGPYVKVEPNFTVYDLIVSYNRSRGGLGLRARVEFEDQPKAALRSGEPSPPPKTEIVSFPFPTPSRGSPTFRVNYFGLGQRFGPKVDLTKDDPLDVMFKELEDNLTSNNPTTLITELAKYYDPTRNWFVAADIEARGWRIRGVFNDPVLYGIEITCTEDQFKGLLIEILYQKLGPNLGVFYGAFTMPTQFRTIQLGAASLTLPSFKIWIYTNGDFKVSVGWPLGPNSIALEIYIFTGGCGFYFAKLRSGDNPESGAKALAALRGGGAEAPALQYNPILEFGLAGWFGVGRSISRGPFSASLSLTVQATFQGIVAWLGDPDKPTSMSKEPDYFWFAATVGIVGQLQGQVDLKVVKLSVLVRLSLSAGLALETDYGTILQVDARVQVQASLRILFITITVGFSASITETFTVASGKPGYGNATLEGPRNPAFKGMNEWALAGLDWLEERLELERAAFAGELPTPIARALPVADAGNQTVDVYFLLQPTATYPTSPGTLQGVATLFVKSPKPATAGLPTAVVAAPNGDDTPTDLEVLVTALATWLLTAYSEGTNEWQTVVTNIGEGSAPAPEKWEANLETFLIEKITFRLNGLDVEKEALRNAKNGDDDWYTALLPMFNDLKMTWTGGEAPVTFADKSRTNTNYADVVAAYFATLSLSAMTYNPPRADSPVSLSSAGAIASTDYPPPTGPSLAQFLFDDYFLTLSRQLARTMADVGTGGLPDGAVVANLGGLTSRYLMNGLRLPDPLTTPPDGHVDPFKLDIRSGYALTGQQFPVNVSVETCEAVLEVREGASQLAKAIAFPPGKTSVTSRMPVPKELPPSPSPVWKSANGKQALAGNDTITIAPIPAGQFIPLWCTQRTRLPWQQGGGAPSFVVPLAADLLIRARERALSLTVQTEPPEGGVAQPLEHQPALCIPIKVHLVARAVDNDVATHSSPPAGSSDENQAPAAGPVSPYLPFVYRLDGTDDETRSRIEHLLRTPGALEGATISLLYNAETTGYRSDTLDLSRHPVVLAKTNLSTTTQPSALTALRHPLAADVGADLGPTHATLDQVPQFLTLLWELSVVHADGFFLRYATADGKDLPLRIFTPPGQVAPAPNIPAGDVADLTVMLTFPRGRSVDASHNALGIPIDGGAPDKLPPDYSGTLYLHPSVDSKSIELLRPSYPPGCIAFSAEWSEAGLLTRAESTIYDKPWIDALYHLMQFRLQGGDGAPFVPSLWSLALSASKDSSGPEIAQETNAPPTFRQVVPVGYFVHAFDPTQNPYGAVGSTGELEFRLNDVFGNELASATHTSQFPVLYNDPLLAPSEWPGVHVAYRFVMSGEPNAQKRPTLTLHFHFEPSEVLRTGPATAAMSVLAAAPGTVPTDDEKLKQQAEVALFRYATVAGQLSDARTATTVRTTVLPANGGVVGDGAAIQGQLRTFVERVQVELRKALAEASTLPEPVAHDVVIDIDPTDLRNLSTNIVPLQVTMTFGRSGFVFTDQGQTVDKSDATTLDVAADLSAPPGGSLRAQARAADSRESLQEDVSLQLFASQFEEVFKGFDGAEGSAWLAAATGTPDLAATLVKAPLWAVRWSDSKGIALAFEASTGAYFSLAPLSTKLFNGPASVPTYDEHAAATWHEATFSGVDLDLWARSFLASFDRILTQNVATAIAALSPATYGDLMLAKAVLAEALGLGLQPVYEDTEAARAARIVRGDIDVAREQFEQAVLNSLASVYSISAVTQVPCTVTAAGDGNDTGAPRLSGSVKQPTDATSKPASAISTAKLVLETSTKEKPAFLTFLVTATEPGAQTNLAAQLQYQPGFIEHVIDNAEADYGYVPSQWLRIATANADAPGIRRIELGILDVPVPATSYPPLPILRSQQAEQPDPTVSSGPGESPLEPYLVWTYGTDLTRGGRESQDQLWIDVEYNRPLNAQLSTGDPLVALFQAFAAFTTAWPVLEPWLAAVPDALDGQAAAGSPEPTAVIEAVAARVKAVASAWAVLRGLADPFRSGKGSSPPAAEAAPSALLDHYVVDFKDSITKGELIVYAHAPEVSDQCDPSAIRWPQINGKDPKTDPAPAFDPCWYVRRYASVDTGQPDTPLKFQWMRVDALTRQTARSTYWIVRNATLSSNPEVTTNPAFVYQTPTVAFASPVVPLITVPPIGPVDGDATSLAKTFVDILAPLAAAGSATGSERLLKVALSYSFPLASPQPATALATPGDTTTIASDTAILLADNIRLVDTSTETQSASPWKPGEPITLQQLGALLEADCRVWYEWLQPVTKGAVLTLAVTLFADVSGARLPLIDAQGIGIKVPDAWWPDGPARTGTRRATPRTQPRASSK